MKAQCLRRLDCRLCGSRELSVVLALTPTPLANAFVAAPQLGKSDPVYPLELVLCAVCKHVQLRDVVDPQVLFRDYVYVSGTSPSFVRHFEDYARKIVERYSFPRGGLVVDVGSNDGTLLGFFRTLGFDVLGIDPANSIAKAATEAGIETLPEFLSAGLAERIARERGRCTLVTANNVFAHVDNLAGFLGAVRSLLADDGLFAFEVSYLADVYEKCLFDTIYHEHLDYHTVAPLEGFFARHGMQLIGVEHIPTHGGSIRGVAQLAGAGRLPNGSVAALAAHERDLGLDRPEAYAGLARRIGGVKSALAKLLAGFKQQDLSIAGFGAPAKATTLMYHFQIGADVLEFIVDDSPLKQGLYSPGMHIPVLPGSAIEERKPDVLVVLAWNFADAIVAKSAGFLRRGGKFVVPLPEVRVVTGP